MGRRMFPAVFAAGLLVCFGGGVRAASPAADGGTGSGGKPGGVRTLRFVQDDAQDYMVSKIYVLKYVQANDITPFLNSMVKRYNMNSVVNCIEYGSQNEQIVTVTTPIGMMPYVDDFIAKVDRPVMIDGKVPGEILRGTGITRATYQPKYRSGQVLVNMIVNAFLNAGPYGSVYGYDKNSNQIYWKDNTTNTGYIRQALGFLDRPAPQIDFTFTVVEMRESDLLDLGIEYLAWKNGPGLNIFQAAFHAFDISSAGTAAIQAMTGPMGGFFFAPQFDASFIRILAQSGKAEIKNTATITVANSDTASYGIRINPQFQNIVKSDNDRTSVTVSSVASQQGGGPQIELRVLHPTVCLHTGGTEVDFTIPDYAPGAYAGLPGTLCFGYAIATANVVERNNYGVELVDTNAIDGETTMALGVEKLLASWSREEKVEETIGVPWLSRIPILKYLFGTTTTRKEKITVCLTVTASVLDTAGHREAAAGKVTRLK